MNNRIEELLKQSTHDVMGVKQVDQKQFAELIVRDCINVIAQWKKEPFPLDADMVSKEIQKHFGVE